jgi:hypothetical protein|tara:strand:+ start:1899 stop:2054 length:156 start_codon:yes stop_codon:yes gene_type:complete
VSDTKEKRDTLDKTAQRMVGSYKERGIKVDFEKTRERLRRNLIKEQNKKNR